VKLASPRIFFCAINILQTSAVASQNVCQGIVHRWQQRGTGLEGLDVVNAVAVRRFTPGRIHRRRLGARGGAFADNPRPQLSPMRAVGMQVGRVPGDDVCLSDALCSFRLRVGVSGNASARGLGKAGGRQGSNASLRWSLLVGGATRGSTARRRVEPLRRDTLSAPQGQPWHVDVAM